LLLEKIRVGVEPAADSRFGTCGALPLVGWRRRRVGGPVHQDKTRRISFILSFFSSNIVDEARGGLPLLFQNASNC
jgi:hypothetical protein